MLTMSTFPQMHAKTSVTANANFSCDRIWLNGKEEPATSGRLASCLASVRQAASCLKTPSVPTVWCVHICSENNFPTAAGLASSAAGYACLVTALCKLYGIQGDTSALARRGSGSACRSVLGGFVRWHMGNMEDGTDSIATQLRPASHWPGMRVLICVASDTQKKTSSSVGMRNSVKTSELLKYRAEYSVPPRYFIYQLGLLLITFFIELILLSKQLRKETSRPLLTSPSGTATSSTPSARTPIHHVST